MHYYCKGYLSFGCGWEGEIERVFCTCMLKDVCDDRYKDFTEEDQLYVHYCPLYRKWLEIA